MLDLHDFASQRASLHQPIGPELKELSRQSLELAYANGLADLTHILVIEPGDPEAHIVDAIGFSPLVSRLDGTRGQLDADVITEHADWWQLTYCVGNSGFALSSSSAMPMVPYLSFRRCVAGPPQPN